MIGPTYRGPGRQKQNQVVLKAKSKVSAAALQARTGPFCHKTRSTELVAAPVQGEQDGPTVESFCSGMHGFLSNASRKPPIAANHLFGAGQRSSERQHNMQR